MQLSQLIQAIDPLKVVGDTNIDITDICFDSRSVQPGSLFVAMRGTQVDGHRFLAQAIDRGAAALVVSDWSAAPTGVTQVQVADTASALGLMADRFYDQPSGKVHLVGVTGTNGKTTTVTLLYDLFTALGYKCGLLSTIRVRIGQAEIDATHTTPDAVQNHQLLADMVEAGCDYVFMEVSSHAVHQKRISGLRFRVAVFTNITHDHLDYHGTFANYLAAKKAFFDDLPPRAYALVNIDDRRGKVMVQNTQAQIRHYSLHRMADFRGRLLENSINGLHLELDGVELYCQLIGGFNAANILAAYGVARLLDQEQREVLQAISALKPAEGRFDAVQSLDRHITGIVDYAHTPDALEKVLQTLDELRQAESRIVTVVGCGGDRDRSKRPKMGAVAVRYSDQVILTSDNPRGEEPGAIIRDMEAGISTEDRAKVLSITDRREAIRTACRLAEKGDVVLVAGKGHEKYQEIDGVKYPFDDKEVLKAELLG